MKKDLKINVSMALIISQVINKLMFSKPQIIGNNSRVYKRELPDRLRYALEFNKKLFDRDIEYYNNKRQDIIITYNFLPPEQFKIKYREALEDLLKEIVNHKIQVIHSEDLDKIEGNIDVNYAQMDVFLRLMCDAPNEEPQVITEEI